MLIKKMLCVNYLEVTMNRITNCSVFWRYRLQISDGNWLRWQECSGLTQSRPLNPRIHALPCPVQFIHIWVESINAFQCKLKTVSPYTPQIDENPVLWLYHVPQLVTSVTVKNSVHKIWPNRFIADVLCRLQLWQKVGINCCVIF
jgi:hypothetical protein